MKHTNLDMDCLRTFVIIVDVGSFAEASLRIGRTASAVSLQVSRLEAQLGAQVFRKLGRKMVLSPEGERVLAMARQILNLNDLVIETLTLQNIAGEINIGAIQDFADSVLPAVLSRFRQAHPRIRLTAKVDRSKVLADAVETGALDLAVGVYGWSTRPHKKIRTDKMVWLGSKEFFVSDNDPVPLVVFEPPCGFREAAIRSLDQAGRNWEVVFTSPSLSGLRAAVEAGLGITVRTLDSFQGNLHPPLDTLHLPKLPSVDFGLYTKNDLSVPERRLCEILVEELGAPLNSSKSHLGR